MRASAGDIALLDQLAHVLLDVETQLVVQLAFDARAVEEGSDSKHQRVKQSHVQLSLLRRIYTASTTRLIAEDRRAQLCELFVQAPLPARVSE